jgi:hypothetical protein
MQGEYVRASTEMLVGLSSFRVDHNDKPQPRSAATTAETRRQHVGRPVEPAERTAPLPAGRGLSPGHVEASSIESRPNVPPAARPS